MPAPETFLPRVAPFVSSTAKFANLTRIPCPSGPFSRLRPRVRECWGILSLHISLSAFSISRGRYPSVHVQRNARTFHLSRPLEPAPVISQKFMSPWSRCLNKQAIDEDCQLCSRLVQSVPRLWCSRASECRLVVRTSGSTSRIAGEIYDSFPAADSFAVFSRMFNWKRSSLLFKDHFQIRTTSRRKK